MALDTKIIYIFWNLNGRHKFLFYSYIYKLGKHVGSVQALCSYAVIYYIMQ